MRAQIDLLQMIIGIILLFAVLYSVIAVLSGRRPSDIEKIAPRRRAAGTLSAWLVVMYLCVVLLATDIGIFAWRYYGPAATTEVKIESPKNGAVATMDEQVRGSSWKVPSGQVIWVILYKPETQKYYPHADSADVADNGEWTSPGTIGGLEDITVDIEIVAVLANNSAQSALGEHVLQNKGKEQPEGMTSIPAGAKIYDRITVTRK